MRADLAVLVVDDDPVVRATAVDLFQDLGFRVYDAYNGEDALRIVRSNPAIGLLFVDVRMPGMDGIALSRAAQEIRPDMKVVFTSGYVDGKGFAPETPFIPKPWSLGEIKSALDTATGA